MTAKNSPEHLTLCDSGAEPRDPPTLQLSPEPPSPVWLVEVSDEVGTRRWPIEEGERLLFGTGPAADVRLSDPLVSGQHGRLSVERGALWVEDVGSLNGTFAAGGVRVVGRARVEPNGCFLAGRSVITAQPFRDEGEGALAEAPLEGLIGESLAMRRVAGLVRRLAPLRAPVLVQGETGTGKELVAQSLHRLGPRRAAPLVALNAAALTGELVDSELFGHEKGAFTGAVAASSGAFEAARGGTLFLDEIAELAPVGQAKLLRALESGEVRAVGSTRPKRVDVRVVAASWAPLGALVRRGAFREDLFHRIAVFSVALPPLRERRADVPALARAFVRQAESEMGRRFELSPSALSRLVAHRWPGNVRELRAAVLRAALRAGDGRIGAREVHAALGEAGGSEPAAEPTKLERRSQVRAVLAAHRGSVSATARELGIARSTVRAWLGR
ncbi:MAG TPA: sigma 54-interacting transcriptional regulator [Polyangiaceae bacterium]|nr:sigma 54-interacting transcriptional regulator [Polyangiaceae bacterium]